MGCREEEEEEGLSFDREEEGLDVEGGLVLALVAGTLFERVEGMMMYVVAAQWIVITCEASSSRMISKMSKAAILRSSIPAP